MRYAPTLLLSVLFMFPACGRTRPALTVTVAYDVNERCTAVILGQRIDVFDTKAFEAALPTGRGRGDEIRIIGGIDTPYRCIGGLIYMAQRRGYHKVGFVAEPAE